MPESWVSDDLFRFLHCPHGNKIQTRITYLLFEKRVRDQNGFITAFLQRDAQLDYGMHVPGAADRGQKDLHSTTSREVRLLSLFLSLQVEHVCFHLLQHFKDYRLTCSAYRRDFSRIKMSRALVQRIEPPSFVSIVSKALRSLFANVAPKSGE